MPGFAMAGFAASSVPQHRRYYTKSPAREGIWLMTSLLTQPQAIAEAATNVAGIRSAISAANAAAAGPTSGVLAAAGDEVSAAVANVFGLYGQEYQAVIRQAAAFHEQFVQALAAAGSAYAQAEAEIASTLGLTGGAAGSQAVTAVTQAADPAVDAILIMSGSGTATPNATFMNNVASRYLSSFTGPLQAVSTPEGLYPVSGVKDLTLDIS